MFTLYFNSITAGGLGGCYLCSIGKAIHFVPTNLNHLDSHS